jgi:predicted transcriptional regulator
MRSGKKRGRKPRILSAGEKKLLKEFSCQLSELVEKRGRTVAVIEAIAEELHVRRASVYNYLKETGPPMPSYSVLEQAHKVFGFKFSYIDFSVAPRRKSRAKRATDAQGILPFPLDSIRKEDVQVVDAKPVRRATALELRVQIRFAS